MKFIVTVEAVEKNAITDSERPFDGGKVHVSEITVEAESFSEVENKIINSGGKFSEDRGVLFRIVKIELL